jgi:hypothetical protein
LREIRHNPEKRTMPVIIHTSQDLSSREMDELKSLGALIYSKRKFSSKEGPEKLREVMTNAGIGS